MATHYRESLEKLFGRSFLKSPLKIDDPVKYIKDSLDRKNNAILKFERDRYQNPDNLPVQTVDSGLISLKYNYKTSSYESFMNQNTRELNIYQPSNPLYYMVVFDAFLGIRVFGNNVVVFDPRPNFVPKKGERAIYPGYDPIYSKTNYDDLVEYIYTTEYPSENIPTFPNFKIGECVVDGSKYNPMYDKRNFRLLGSYRDDGVFVASEMREYYPSLTNGSMIDRGGQGAYMLMTDVYNSGPQDVYGDGEIYKVIGSGLLFREIDPEVIQLNKTYGTEEVYTSI
jgi:hypothetical protein